jgi:hypothetical protein
MPRRKILLALLAALFWSLVVLLFIGYFFLGWFDG